MDARDLSRATWRKSSYSNGGWQLRRGSRALGRIKARQFS